MNNVKDVLLSIGYVNIVENATELRTRPIYRDSDNNNSLKIDRVSGRWIDFGTNQHGSLDELVKLTLGISSNDSKNYLQDIDLKSIPRPLKKYIPKFFDNPNTIQDDSYWNNRGISTNTLSLFNGGVSMGGKMKDRYVFPIYDISGRVLGASGRLLVQSEYLPKWKHIGPKNFWFYPYFINHEDIKQLDEIIIVESIGDCLSLFEMGIKNVIVLFGLFISRTMLCNLIKLDPSRIVIALNNDVNKGNRGNEASISLEHKLLKHFDRNQIQIRLPTKKDFNEMLMEDKESINIWKNAL